MTNSPKSTAHEKSTLSTGNYTIEFSNGPSHIYKLDEQNNKIWIAAAADPNLAMLIIEGLILVEHKRFYHPEAEPTVSIEGKGEAPPFLKK